MDDLIEMRARDGSRVLVGRNRLAYHRDVEGCVTPEEWDAAHAGPAQPTAQEAKPRRKPRAAEPVDPFPPLPGEESGS